MSSNSSFNIRNALYFVKYPSRAEQNSPAGRGLKTPALCELQTELQHIKNCKVPFGTPYTLWYTVIVFKQNVTYTLNLLTAMCFGSFPLTYFYGTYEWFIKSSGVAPILYTTPCDWVTDNVNRFISRVQQVCAKHQEQHSSNMIYSRYPIRLHKNCISCVTVFDRLLQIQPSVRGNHILRVQKTSV